MREALAADKCQVVATAEVHVLDIGDRDRICLIAQVDPVDPVTKIDADAALGRIEDQCLVRRTTNQRRFRRLAAVGVEVLADDAVATAVLVLIFPGNDKAAVVESRHRRIILMARGIGVDPELVALLGTRGIKHLTINTVTRTILTAGLPGDGKATLTQRRDRRIALGAARITVDPELVALLGTVGIEHLSVDIRASAVIPGDDKRIIGKRCHRRIILLTGRGIGVDQELAIAVRRAVGCEALTVDAVLAAILAIRHPGDDVTAVTETSHRRLLLMVIGMGVDLELAARNRCRRIHTRRRKLLAKDSVVAAVGKSFARSGGIPRLIAPGHDKVAAAEIGHRRRVLIARSVAVDRKRITQDLGIAIEALADDAVTGGVVRILRAVRFPGNEEAAVAEPRDRRVVLIVMRVGADQELTAKGFAAVGIALAVNVVVTAVAVLVIGLPDHHVAAGGQLVDRCVDLVVMCKGVNPELVFRIAGEGQLAVTELDRLDVLTQRVGAVVTVGGIPVSKRPVGHVETVVRHLAGVEGNVISVATGNHVITGTADHHIITGAALDQVVTNAAVDAVVAATALKLILTGIALKDIIAARTGNPIITITTEQVVRSTAAHQRIVAIAAVDSTESIGAAELMTDRRRIVIRATQRCRILGAAAGRKRHSRRRRRQDDLAIFRTRARPHCRADRSVSIKTG